VAAEDGAAGAVSMYRAGVAGALNNYTLILTVTGQLADTPTRGLPTCGLDISQTGQLAD